MVSMAEMNLALLFLLILFIILFFSTIRVILNSNENHKIYIEEYESYLIIKNENKRLLREYYYYQTDEAKIAALRETYDLSRQDDVIIRMQESQAFLEETKTYFDSPPKKWIANITQKLIGI